MSKVKLPNLPECFLPPANWQSGDFDNPETGHHIHYNFVLPDNTPKGIIVALPGLSEFGEKYSELAHEVLQRGYSFYVIDWAYQGRSTRFKANPHKRHIDGYDADLSDIDYLISTIIGAEKPLFMLGHSMGGHIGLRYLQTHPDTIQAAGFTAPMIGIKDLRYTKHLLEFIFKYIKIFDKKYVPGGSDWSEKSRKSDGSDIFSNDPKRDQIHEAWSCTTPELQVGNVTIKWVYESLKSCRILNKQENIDRIKTPFVVSIAEQEVLVDNKSIKKFMCNFNSENLISLPNTKHEIFMEADESRSKFLNAFFALIEKKV